jgi:hypothetical protein
MTASKLSLENKHTLEIKESEYSKNEESPDDILDELNNLYTKEDGVVDQGDLSNLNKVASNDLSKISGSFRDRKY